MKTAPLAAVCALAASICLLPAAAYADMASQSDRQFIRAAGYGGNDEIALSKVAAVRSNDPNVRMFARRMIRQHSEAGAELAQIAKSLGVTPPAVPDAKHRMMKAQLERLGGRAFNMTYINDMVADHTAANNVFQMGTTVTNSDLRSFADSTLPVVQNHLKMAAEMQQELKQGGRMAAM